MRPKSFVKPPPTHQIINYHLMKSLSATGWLSTTTDWVARKFFFGRIF
jgi:hypothetical protein